MSQPRRRNTKQPRFDIADAALRVLGWDGRCNVREPLDANSEIARTRKLIADAYRLVGSWLLDARGDVAADTSRAASIDKPDHVPTPEAGQRAAVNQAFEALSPRLRQTLLGLLAGEAEKEIAKRMGISQHTVHSHVKALHKRFEVNSRGELLAHFVTSPLIEPDSPK